MSGAAFGTGLNVRGQISVHIFAPNGGYCLYTLGNPSIPVKTQVLWDILGDYMVGDYMCTNMKYLPNEYRAAGEKGRGLLKPRPVTVGHSLSSTADWCLDW